MTTSITRLWSQTASGYHTDIEDLPCVYEVMAGGLDGWKSTSNVTVSLPLETHVVKGNADMARHAA